MSPEDISFTYFRKKDKKWVTTKGYFRDIMISSKKSKRGIQQWVPFCYPFPGV